METKKILIENLQEFKNHPFRSYSEDALYALSESIRNYGLQHPIIVREISNNLYEIIAGHNRVRACKLAGIKEIEADIRDVDDDEAKLIMAETNLRQRRKISIVEKAKAYAIEAEALLSQGRLQGTTKRRELERKFGESGKQIERYLKIAGLPQAVQKRIEDGQILFGAAVLLAKLPAEKLELFTECFFEYYPDEKLTEDLILYIENEKIDSDTMLVNALFEYFYQKQGKQTADRYFRISRTKIEKFVPNWPEEQICELIEKLLRYRRLRMEAQTKKDNIAAEKLWEDIEEDHQNVRKLTLNATRRK